MDTLTPEARSERMALVRGKGNRSTEVRMIALFRLRGITGWRRGQKLFGRPDFVFRRKQVAIFIDGDFWHGHPRLGRMPKSNVGFWSAKIAANRRRDRKVNATLRAAGWTVVRVWESTLAKRPDAVARRILSALGDFENRLGEASASC
jgi:DNA mismatch endonuclease (patch repair protein)